MALHAHVELRSVATQAATADRTGDETRRQLNGALLTKDETRILSWSDNATVRLRRRDRRR
jgi:hypothetical protein